MYDNLSYPAFRNLGEVFVVILTHETEIVMWTVTDEAKGRKSFQIQHRQSSTTTTLDGGVLALDIIAQHFGAMSDTRQAAMNLGLTVGDLAPNDIERLAIRIGLRVKVVSSVSVRTLKRCSKPAMVRLGNGKWSILGKEVQTDRFRFVSPTHPDSTKELGSEEIFKERPSCVILFSLIDNNENERSSTSLNWFISSAWVFRGSFFNILFASFFIQILALSSPLIFQLVIDKALVHKSQQTLIVLLSAMLFIAVFEGCLKYLRAYMLNVTSAQLDSNLGRDIFEHLMQLPISYFEARPAGITLSRAREIESIRSFLTGQGLLSIVDVLFVAITIVILFFYSIDLALVVLSSFPIYILIVIVCRPLLQKRLKEKFTKWSLTQQHLVETIVAIHTIKSSSAEQISESKWNIRFAAYLSSTIRTTMTSTKAQTLIELVTKISSVAILYFGTREVISGDLTLGALVAFNMLAGQTTQPVLRLSQLWQDVQQVQISLQRLGDVLDADVEPRPLHIPPMNKLRGAIEFQGVSFRYENSNFLAIKNINISIAAGEVVGVVGPSGSGKSTLSKIIQRYYIPTEGDVFIDGMRIKECDPRALRRQMGIVTQESLLLNCSVHDNIALGFPRMSRTHVIWLAQLSGAHEFIVQLPNGYDTAIEERGTNLSGGQRQRVAIARALAADPKIVIFDEATSALDYESERTIRKNMRHIAQGRTVIIIAHRLAAVRDCDRIIGMESGQIRESGSHSELIKSPGGLYRRLWDIQCGLVED